MDAPRITLRPEDVAEMHRDFPVREVRIYVAEQDWEPFLAVAYYGMEIPVAVEGTGQALTAVLIAVYGADQSITVVI